MAIRRQPPRVRRAAILLSLLVCLAAGPALYPGAAVNASTGATTELSLQRTIQATPFVRSDVSMHDSEGSAYVGRDNALWLVDDNAQRIYIVNPSTGELKRVIGSRTLAAVRRYRGTQKAGAARIRDLESAAYDAARDRMYVFAGNNCYPEADNCQIRSRPTAFRFDRVSGRLRPHSFQPLWWPGADPTAAAWNPADEKVYIGKGRTIRPYSFTRNRRGAKIPRIDTMHEILGMDFNARGTALWVVHHTHNLSRVDWETKTRPGWPRDLTGFGVGDARAVEQIGGKLFISDGYDHHPENSRLRYAVFVFELTSSG